MLGRRAVLSVGFVEPLSAPRPFDFEIVTLLNISFGGPARPARSPITPPPLFGN